MPELRTEAIRFSRYLVGDEPGDELVARYCAANAELFAAAPTAADASVIGFAHAHPWAIPLLDAGTAITGRAPLFRKKLLVMMAILETTPAFADRTAPRAAGLGTIAVQVGLAGVRTVVNVVAGVALAAALTGRRHGE